MAKRGFLALARMVLALAMLSPAWARSAGFKRYPQIREQLPVTVQITRATPVFEDPSARSKILADADISTQLIAREISEHGGWLLVEDEDGNKGWVPTKRTDLVKVLRAQAGSKVVPPSSSQKIETQSDEASDSEIEEARTRGRPVLPPDTVVFAPYLYAGNRGGGAAASILFPSTAGDSLETSEHTLFGFDAGAYRVWKQGRAQESYTLPLRVRMIRRSLTTSWATGPDLALLFRTWDRSLGTGIGYGVYYMPRGDRGLFAGLRGGLELGGRTHYLIEWSLGWML
jgi:hypothetical protein